MDIKKIISFQPPATENVESSINRPLQQSASETSKDTLEIYQQNPSEPFHAALEVPVTPMPYALYGTPTTTQEMLEMLQEIRTMILIGPADSIEGDWLPVVEMINEMTIYLKENDSGLAPPSWQLLAQFQYIQDAANQLFGNS